MGVTIMSEKPVVKKRSIVKEEPAKFRRFFKKAIVVLALLLLFILLAAIGESWNAIARAFTIIFMMGILLTALAWIIGDKTMTRIVKRGDRLISAAEWRFNRMQFEKVIRWRQWLMQCGHSWILTALTTLVALSIVFGPTWELRFRFQGAAVWIIVPGLMVLILVVNRLWATFRTGKHTLEKVLHFDRSAILTHNGILLLTSLAVFHIGADKVQDPGLYRHILIPSLWALQGMMLLAWLLSRLLFSCWEFPSFLKDLKPIESDRPEPEGIDWVRFSRSLIKAPIKHPLEILFIPAFWTVMVLERGSMVQWAYYWGIFAWVIFATAEMHERIDRFLGLYRRVFFLGGQAAISIIVIVLAAGRLFRNSYITTLVEGGDPLCVVGLCISNRLLSLYILTAYLFFWYFEYWANRMVCEHILGIFRREDANENTKYAGRISVKYKKPDANEVKDGYLQIHGSSRFALLSGDSQKILRTVGRMRLVDDIIDNHNTVITHPKYKVSPREFNLVFKHRIQFYFTCLMLLLSGIVVYYAYHHYSAPQRAGLNAKTREGTFCLRAHLFGEETQDHVILLAASGGGTRAALYTWSILRGLRELDALGNLKLVSGVSGGSAALAYFAAHRDRLDTQPDNESDTNPWLRFREVMASPFISDVLKGTSEWRILTGVNHENPPDGRGIREVIRIGELLKESFERRFQGVDSGTDPDYKKTLADRATGFIFNTTLAGRFRAADCLPEDGGIDPDDHVLSEIETTVECKKVRSSLPRGGRLVLTNLDGRSLKEFPAETSALKESPGDYLTYVMVKDPSVPLATAAALSANFPPVFPNAAVDLDNGVRYWITDGGAADNRGILSLLYALKGAVNAEHDAYCNNDCDGSTGRSRPDIHIILADAGAASLVYSQDRGVSAPFGASERFASQIMVDVYKEVKATYGKLKGKIHFHNLSMPLTLRSGGGIGTHWMMPRKVSLGRPFGHRRTVRSDIPHKAPQSGENLFTRLWRFVSFHEPDVVELDAGEAIALVEILHRVGDPKDYAEKIKTEYEDLPDLFMGGSKPLLLEYICNDRLVPHAARWRGLTRALGKDVMTYDAVLCPEQPQVVTTRR
jgi:hypothetical protein